jgi:hypothetical protein
MTKFDVACRQVINKAAAGGPRANGPAERSKPSRCDRLCIAHGITTAAGNHRGRHYLTTRPCLDRRAVGSHGRPGAILAFCRSGLGTTEEVFSMCDYSLHNVKSRPAKVGDKLTTHHFNTGTRGFAAGGCQHSSLCSSRNGTRLCQRGRLSAAHFARLESEYS